MKNNVILAVLTGVFFVCAAVTCVFVWNYRSGLHQLSDAETKVNYVKGVLGPTLQALLNDTSEYSKKDAAVIPILQSLTNNMNRAAAPAARPATR